MFCMMTCRKNLVQRLFLFSQRQCPKSQIVQVLVVVAIAKPLSISLGPPPLELEQQQALHCCRRGTKLCTGKA